MEAHDLESQLPAWVNLGKHLSLQVRITTMSCMRIQWRHRVARGASEVLTEALGEPMLGRASIGEVGRSKIIAAHRVCLFTTLPQNRSLDLQKMK